MVYIYYHKKVFFCCWSIFVFSHLFLLSSLESDRCSPILWNCISCQGWSATILDMVGKFERWRWREKPSDYCTQWRRLWLPHPDGNFYFSLNFLCCLHDSRPTWPTMGSAFLPAFLAKFSVQTLTKPSSERQILWFLKNNVSESFARKLFSERGEGGQSCKLETLLQKYHPLWRETQVNSE